jgi:topoisomerase IA-like protein
MQFSEREDVKGDFKIFARGSSSLVAKELRAQRLNDYVGTIGPADEPYIKRGELNRHRAQSMDLPEDVVRTDEEYDEVEQMRQTIQELAGMLTQLGINPETGQPIDTAGGSMPGDAMPGTGVMNA